MKKTKILIMAGGTGGHIFPGLAVADELIKQGLEVAFLGTAHGLESKIVPEHGIHLFTIDVFGLRSSGIKRLITAPFTLLKALWQAIKVIRAYKPQAILGMGGFASGPGGMAAFLLRVPLVLHDQNSIPGFTNKMLSRFACTVFTAFPNAFPSKKSKFVYVGNPIRKEIAEMSPPLERFSSRQGPLRILILGGSRGAMALNMQIPQALVLLKFPVEIRHQSGQQFVENTKQVYKELNLDADVFPFISDMREAYEWADLLICRSGAMTVSEVLAAGLPAIFIPFPHAVDDHQTHNAMFLVEAGAAKLIQQKGLTAEHLASLISSLEDRKILLKMASKAYSLRKVDATKVVAEKLYGRL
jgi:UDP-N-acetylglucosamine--N-acetylmuramyl-(pentapeptide) pyrophosphoryl-undecaprenol N-acetylglucosamine transferase